MSSKNIVYFLSGLKGLLVLKNLIDYNKFIDFVFIEVDKKLTDDSSSEIRDVCIQNSISFEFFSTSTSLTRFNSVQFVAIAIGWKRLINNLSCTLIVMHDSLLPKYRGYAPTVAQLINREEKLGVTAFFASQEYDCGDIVATSAIDISYPCTIRDAIEKITLCYFHCIESICNSLESTGFLSTYPQSQIGSPTYTIWRDEYDYFVDWSFSASKLLRTINALGSPYDGAQTMINNTRVIIENAEIFLDPIVFEEVHCGKIFKLINGLPVVICGEGSLLFLSCLTRFDDKIDFRINKLRSRFYKPTYEKFLTF